ncbi:hypothetical protein THAOC_17480, partial [Thalassiosira oceanica]
KGRLYRVPLESDKHVKAARGSKRGDEGAGWTFPFAGGESLDVVPVGSFGADGSAGLAARHANGGVVPVLDLAVLFGGGDGGFVGGKDYLNHRYTDVSLCSCLSCLRFAKAYLSFQRPSPPYEKKRNILAVHVARQLSQKKHRKAIGEVHLCQVFGDARKVGLLLTPPDEEPGKKDSKKKKRKRGGEEAKGGEKKAAKLRFRVRLIFGVKPTVGAESGDDDDSDASSPGLESWIPTSRLLPDRRNNRPLRSKGDDEEDEDDEAGPATDPDAGLRRLHALPRGPPPPQGVVPPAGPPPGTRLVHDHDPRGGAGVPVPYQGRGEEDGAGPGAQRVHEVLEHVRLARRGRPRGVAEGYHDDSRGRPGAQDQEEEGVRDPRGGEERVPDGPGLRAGGALQGGRPGEGHRRRARDRGVRPPDPPGLLQGGVREPVVRVGVRRVGPARRRTRPPRLDHDGQLPWTAVGGLREGEPGRGTGGAAGDPRGRWRRRDGACVGRRQARPGTRRVPPAGDRGRPQPSPGRPIRLRSGLLGGERGRFLAVEEDFERLEDGDGDYGEDSRTQQSTN